MPATPPTRPVCRRANLRKRYSADGGRARIGSIGEEPAELLRHRLGGRVPPLRFPGHRLEHDRLQVARQGGPKPARGNRLGGDQGLEHLHRGVAAKRRLPGQEPVEDRAQGVDIGRRPDLAAGGLFRGHVLRSPHRQAGRGQAAVGVHRPRQAEVGDLGDRPGQRAIPGSRPAVRSGAGCWTASGRGGRPPSGAPHRSPGRGSRPGRRPRCGGQGSPPSRSARVPPATHSIARKGRPSWSPTS